jgi:hypothetical protein
MGTIYTVYADLSDWDLRPNHTTWAGLQSNSVSGRQAVYASDSNARSFVGVVYDGAATYPFGQRQWFSEFQLGGLPRGGYDVDLSLQTFVAPKDDFATEYELVVKDWVYTDVNTSVNDTNWNDFPTLAKGPIRTSGRVTIPRTTTKLTLLSDASPAIKMALFCSRIRGTAPSGGPQESLVEFHTADASGTTLDPYLQLELEVFITSYTSGAGIFTVPPNVTSLTVEGWGGGGGGGIDASQEPGGGGAAYAKSVFAVTPGQQINYSVGAGGNPGNAGADSWVFNASTLLAKGGGGGNAATPGAGGLAASSIGEIKFSGGSGGAQQGGGGTRGGSGGGAAASEEGNGASGSSGSSGVGGAGGIGVAGAGSGGRGSAGGGNDALPGTSPGGGGGGKGTGASSTSQPGGSGRIIFRYVESLPSGNTSLKAYVAGAFVTKPVKFWSGTSWLVKPVKRWNSSAWV